ncbi:rRNA pseudouridine synthase [Candidatus Woesearchaeota archaeon]|nr:rRNA pseudouridine synthase [Candidatus Woesearchaeota archaeon]
MSKKTSLKQFLMKSGKFRRMQDCIESIISGKIYVNNEIINNPNYFFNPKKSLVKTENKKIKKARKLYFLMNKPAGYLSQKAESEKTIYDLLIKLHLSQEEIQSLSAVGRLDKDTEGLMIITNDGKLSDFIMHPKNEIIKRYNAVLENPAANDSLKLLEKGVIIEIDDAKYKTTKCRIKKVKENEVYISITEGKKRQIRKMFETVGNKVAYLKRVSIGGLALGNLKAGDIKEISRQEILEKLEI